MDKRENERLKRQESERRLKQRDAEQKRKEKEEIIEQARKNNEVLLEQKKQYYESKDREAEEKLMEFK